MRAHSSCIYRSKSAVPNKLFALNTSHRVVHTHLVYNLKRGRCGAVLFTKILLLLLCRGRKCSRVLGPHSVKVGSTLTLRFGHATEYVSALSAPGQPFSAGSSKVLSKQRLSRLIADCWIIFCFFFYLRHRNFLKE